MSKEKKPVGRPEKENVKKVRSVRIDDPTLELIKRKYGGSLQRWADHHVNVEFSKAVRNGKNKKKDK